MNRFGVRIHENANPGLKLEDLEKRLVKYLNKKKAQESVSVNGATNYILRNGLLVNIYSRNGDKTLNMLVVGNRQTFEKSVEAMRKIYAGPIEITYL